ncbi:MAG: UbiX family flavin prenyltransferase [Deltaproteobacteria bacterium]|jgi:4-hydroxy-3-polyprenylbenzoate decarboxylase|nr:UbiX family flavin prenyltransferase [Deltaproteobacteria bacterium]
MRLVVGITGGSGAVYALGLLQALGELGVRREVVVSRAGELVLAHECGTDLAELAGYADVLHDNADIAASVASGSHKTDGMVIVPCSMKTLAAVAHGYSESLLTRAADVTIKERRRLVVVPRETPLSPLHLENMLKLSRLGAVVLPPSPAFYQRPESLADVVKFVVGKILDQLGLEHALCRRWEGAEP